jgi:hypothetical protein
VFWSAFKASLVEIIDFAGLFSITHCSVQLFEMASTSDAQLQIKLVTKQST